jgi:betaine-aldehyde dehydrogenase
MTDGTPWSPLQNFVNGKFVDASDGRISDVIDPSTGEVYAHAPVSGRQDVDAAMQAAANAFEAWRESTPSERSLGTIRAPFAGTMEHRAGYSRLAGTSCRL